MSSKRLHLALLVVLGLLFTSLIVGTYGTNKLLTAKSSELTALKAKSQALIKRDASVKVAKKQIAQYTGLQKVTQTIVPEDKSQAEAVREIVNIAAANKVGLASITFPASTLGNSPNGQAPSTTTTPSPAAAAALTKTAGLSQLVPVKTIPGLYQLTITVQSDAKNPISYNRFVAFLAGLENNRRTAQVSNIAISPNLQDTSVLSFSLNLNEYIKP